MRNISFEYEKAIFMIKSAGEMKWYGPLEAEIYLWFMGDWREMLNFLI